MHVVRLVNDLIKRGVSSVATTFHPFSGAVDIIVVKQQDGTYRSTPWYVQFGKFQGVLKGADKIVRIFVNGVEANFHMYLDNSGEAYFLREVVPGSEENGQDSSDFSSFRTCEDDKVSNIEGVHENEHSESKVEVEGDSQSHGSQDEHSHMHSPYGSPGYSTNQYERFDEVEEKFVKSTRDSNSEMVLMNTDGHGIRVPISMEKRNVGNTHLSTPQERPDGRGDVCTADLHCNLNTSEDKDTGATEHQNEDNEASIGVPIYGSKENNIRYVDNERSLEVRISGYDEKHDMLKSYSDLALHIEEDDSQYGCKSVLDLEKEENFEDSSSATDMKFKLKKKEIFKDNSSVRDIKLEEAVDDHNLRDHASSAFPSSDTRSSPDMQAVDTERGDFRNNMGDVSQSNDVHPNDHTCLHDAERLLLMNIEPEDVENKVDEDSRVLTVHSLSSKTENKGVQMGFTAGSEMSPEAEECNKPDSVSRRIYQSGFEISLCGNLLVPGMGQNLAKEIFQAYQISENEFKVYGQDIIKNENLVLRYDERYYTWNKVAHILLGITLFGSEFSVDPADSIPVEHVEVPNDRQESHGSPLSTSTSRWTLWPISFRRVKLLHRNVSVSSDDEVFVDSASSFENPLEEQADIGSNLAPRKSFLRTNIPTNEQIMSLDLKDGQNTISFSFSPRFLGTQQVNAHIYLWKWNTRIVISDVDGTITRSDILGQVMPLVGKDWTQSGVANLFSAIEENGYQLLFLSARAIVQSYLTKSFLVNLKQDGKTLPTGPVVISPDGLFPSLFREVIRRSPHEFKIACLQDIRELFPPDYNPFYAGFGNRDTDELTYRALGIPKGKIFIINPKGEVALYNFMDMKSYTSLHKLVNDMFPPTSLLEQEDYNSWNYWKLPLPSID
ncbi:phosphatidate phosphatase PAH1-like [Asparagus officinalis]|uniref:phosphatidate phosphatase PAH1-like n=1 Tax=Asparagus officinalis TaxID=4686 RepID=UPI00098DEDFF|nr:phosphatidate phosphatase PAH1-like [Asparagus officinalis]XP_020275806.1 phosphatidate phosphatase PAH1-like [Asparagus officinalis]